MSDFGRLQELAREAGLAVGPPSYTLAPAVTPEVATVGEALSCSTGEWAGEPTGYTYQWFSDGAEVGTAASYTTAAAGVVNCVVTATNTAGSAIAPSSNSVSVTAVMAARRVQTEPNHTTTRTTRTTHETTRG